MSETRDWKQREIDRLIVSIGAASRELQAAIHSRDTAAAALRQAEANYLDAHAQLSQRELELLDVIHDRPKTVYKDGS